MLADAAVAHFGANGAPPESELPASLRVVLHPASLGREQTAFEGALSAARQDLNVVQMKAMVRELLGDDAERGDSQRA